MAGWVWWGKEETLIVSQWYWIIPNSVLFDKSLTDKRKLLFCLISSLCAEKGHCWASNKFLWDKLWVSAWTISKWIKKLIELGYISSEVDKIKWNTRHITIAIVINHNTSCEKSQYPYCEKSQHNITSNNITKEKEISSKEEIEQRSIWKKEINDLIDQIKQECDLLGVAYDKQDDRNFARHILIAKEYWAFCEKIWQGRVEFAVNVLKASVGIGYWKWIASWPMKIYQNYADIYNETLKYKTKNSKNLIQSF